MVAAWAGRAAAPIARPVRPTAASVVRSVNARLLLPRGGGGGAGLLGAELRDHEERGHEDQQHREVGNVADLDEEALVLGASPAPGERGEAVLARAEVDAA